MSGRSVIIGFIVVLLVVGGIYYFAKKSPKATSNTQTSQTESTDTEAVGGTSGMLNLTGKNTINIVFSNGSIVSSKVSVSRGTTVIWVNQDTVNHKIVSDYQPLRSYEMRPGESFSVVFDEVGEFSYSDALSASEQLRGIIVVE